MPVEALDRVVVGRQSIHDRRRAVVGYELRFAELAAPDSDTVPGVTRSAVFGALDHGLDRLVGDKRVFCIADREQIVGTSPLTLVPARSVIEVDASDGADDELIAGCRRLVSQGYTIALTGFTACEGVDALLGLASIVKIDVHLHGAVLADRLARCRRRGAMLLAANVETPADLDLAQALGFDLFQGYALQRPAFESGQVVAAGDVTRLQASARLLGQALDFDEVEAVLRTEPGLTYQVMQLASVGRTGETRRRISSLRDALVLAGTWRIQNWISLLLARPTEGGSREAVTTALARASAVESLAADLDRASARIGFAAGMLSSFEDLLQIPAEQLCATLPLSEELRQAAFGTRTPLGRIVCDVADHQAGTQYPRMLSGLTRGELDTALAAAFLWAAEASAALG